MLVELFDQSDHNIEKQSEDIFVKFYSCQNVICTYVRISRLLNGEAHSIKEESEGLN